MKYRFNEAERDLCSNPVKKNLKQNKRICCINKSKIRDTDCLQSIYQVSSKKNLKRNDIMLFNLCVAEDSGRQVADDMNNHGSTGSES